MKDFITHGSNYFTEVSSFQLYNSSSYSSNNKAIDNFELYVILEPPSNRDCGMLVFTFVRDSLLKCQFNLVCITMCRGDSCYLVYLRNMWRALPQSYNSFLWLNLCIVFAY